MSPKRGSILGGSTVVFGTASYRFGVEEVVLNVVNASRAYCVSRKLWREAMCWCQCMGTSNGWE